MIKKLFFTGLILTIIYGFLFILKIWFDIFDSKVFLKISITFLVIGGIILIALGILYAIKEDEELEKGNHIG